MAQYEKQTTMTITKDDRALLSFGNYVLADIITAMISEGAGFLEDIETAEIIPLEELKIAQNVIEILIDAQEEWKWRFEK